MSSLRRIVCGPGSASGGGLVSSPASSAGLSLPQAARGARPVNAAAIQNRLFTLLISGSFFPKLVDAQLEAAHDRETHGVRDDLDAVLAADHPLHEQVG